MKTKYLQLLSIGALLTALLNGCALGVTNVRVAHSSLDPVAPKREGTLLVRQFVDSRKQDHQYIGTKRNGFGMALGSIGIRDGKHTDVLVTEFFVDALRHAGYNVVIQAPDASGSLNATAFDAVLEGEIQKFWLDLYLATWHDVDVHLKLLDRAGQQVVWEKDIHGGESNVLWLGLKSEFEKVIRQALDQALNRAAKEFASEEFYQKVKAEKVPADIHTKDETGKQPDLYTELMKLDDLRKKGLITDAEFDAQKEKLLNSAK